MKQDSHSSSLCNVHQVTCDQVLKTKLMSFVRMMINTQALILFLLHIALEIYHGLSKNELSAEDPC